MSLECIKSQPASADPSCCLCVQVNKVSLLVRMFTEVLIRVARRVTSGVAMTLNSLHFTRFTLPQQPLFYVCVCACVYV